jgi:hypothetical protein
LRHYLFATYSLLIQYLPLLKAYVARLSAF